MSETTIYKDEDLLSARQNEFAKLLATGKFSDFIVESSDGHQFKVHKTILSTTCPYFRKKFDGTQKRGDALEIKDNSLKLTDIEKDVLFVILNYLYTGEAKFENNKAKEIFVKSEFFELKNLQKYCSEILEAKLSRENCQELFRFAVFLLADDLRDKCVKFYCDHVDQFDESFIAELSVEEVIVLISKSEYLKEIVDQEKLFSYILSWIKKDFQNRDSFLMRVMKIIDFNKISDDFIQNVLLTDAQIRNNNEFLAEIMILMFQRMKR